MTAEITVDRAMSDYLSVSRRAHLYGPGEYDEAEERAWARLQEALAAAGDEADDGTGLPRPVASPGA
jgi:hypothetical protein